MSSRTVRPAWPTRCRRTVAEFGRAGPLLVLSMVGPLLGAAALAATATAWLPCFAGDVPSGLLLVLCGAISTAACLLPTHATSLVAGFLFPGWLGPCLAWLVVVLGAAAGFVLSRWLVGARLLAAMAAAPRAAAVHRALLCRGFPRAAWLIMLLRLSPLMPFSFTNLLLAGLSVPFRTFFVATVVGITPRVVAVAFVGAELQALDWQAGGWLSGSTGSVAVAIGTTLLVLFVIGRTARAALRRQLADGEAS